MIKALIQNQFRVLDPQKNGTLDLSNKWEISHRHGSVVFDSLYIALIVFFYVFRPPVASASVGSKVKILLLLIHCFLLLSLYVGVLYLVLVWDVILSVLSSLTIISLRKRELLSCQPRVTVV